MSPHDRYIVRAWTAWIKSRSCRSGWTSRGTPCELTFGYALPSGESLTLTAHAVYLPRPRIEIAGPQGVQATFDWQAARDSVLGRMATITLVNDIEEY
jgi:hypothetical protein